MDTIQDTITTAPPAGLGKGKIKFSTDTLTSSQAAVKVDSVAAKPGKQSRTLGGNKRHSPLKAGLFSAALPGLGQIYNKRYWKPPIIYAGFGGLGYAMYYTASKFTTYRNAYRLQVDGNPNTIGSVNGIEDAATLKVYRDYYKRFVDITGIGMAVWYLLNIVDASVDAHLFEWNMKDDISVSWKPVGFPSQSTAMVHPGITIAVRF